MGMGGPGISMPYWGAIQSRGDVFTWMVSRFEYGLGIHIKWSKALFVELTMSSTCTTVKVEFRKDGLSDGY